MPSETEHWWVCTIMQCFYLQIHEEMVSKTAWDNEMKSFSWRIDACSRARHMPQLNSMSAIAEMQLGPHGKPVRGYTMRNCCVGEEIWCSFSHPPSLFLYVHMCLLHYGRQLKWFTLSWVRSRWRGCCHKWRTLSEQWLHTLHDQPAPWAYMGQYTHHLACKAHGCNIFYIYITIYLLSYFVRRLENVLIINESLLNVARFADNHSTCIIKSWRQEYTKQRGWRWAGWNLINDKI